MAKASRGLPVSLTLDWMARLVGNHPQAWIAFGNFESKLLAPDLTPLHIRQPVYIAGLARAGSTVLLEMLAAQRGAVTHRYQDFPFVFTPYWWNMVLKCLPWRNKKKRERAHGDGIMISPQSPEAMEEMLWMSFFPYLHHASQSEVMEAPHPVFERFYCDHIRKLLLAHGGERYVCKNNYNVTRMAYLHTLFPDARFVIPVRNPATHIASLMRQHERFCSAGEKNPRVVRQMMISGHFEFGPGRQPIHAGDARRVQDIQEAWRRGDEITGWALYWDMLHRFLRQQLQCNAALEKQALVVRFEQLTSQPKETLRTLLAHCGFAEDAAWLDRQATALHAPDYYQPLLSEADTARITEIAGETARWFGY